MEILTKQANMIEAYITESYVEKEEEIATLSTIRRRPGSIVICIDTGHVYVLNSKHQWSLLGGDN